MKRLHPNGSSIFVKPIEEDKVNGLYIPVLLRRKAEPNRLARVIAHGPLAPVKNDDIVVIGVDAGDELLFNKELLLHIKPGAIQAIK